jgi:hypothetical protein
MKFKNVYKLFTVMKFRVLWGVAPCSQVEVSELQLDYMAAMRTWNVAFL